MYSFKCKYFQNRIKAPAKKRNLFNDPFDEPPKLRRSIVARAVQDIVSSTPFVKTPNCFIGECSLNISPINPISEEDERGIENDKNAGVVVISSESNILQSNDEENFKLISELKNKNPSLVKDTTTYSNNRKDKKKNKGRYLFK